jgi:hypothetical protein
VLRSLEILALDLSVGPEVLTAIFDGVLKYVLVRV